jgi:hypothetical protein
MPLNAYPNYLDKIMKKISSKLTGEYSGLGD